MKWMRPVRRRASPITLPSGSIAAPTPGSSNADWNALSRPFVPLTAGAKIYDLEHDVNDEGFATWSINVAETFTVPPDCN